MFNSLSDRLTATFKNLRGKGRLTELMSMPPFARFAVPCWMRTLPYPWSASSLGVSANVRWAPKSREH